MVKGSFKGRDVLSISDFSREDLLHILSVAGQLEKKPRPDLLKGKIMASLFFEPSTRTKLSFAASMIKLGGQVIGFADVRTTSVKKGETLWDTTKMVEAYSDVIVTRNDVEGAPRLMSEASSIPVVNAGDGANQHPTQTLLDLYTIQKEHGSFDGMTIGFVGDLKYGRTVHSLAVALSHFKCSMHFVAPAALKMPDSYITMLKEKGITVEETDDLDAACKHFDVLYMTRIQEERFPDPIEYQKYKSVYKIDKRVLELCKESVKIMHPLPRVGEIDPKIDETPNAIYFKQAANGIPVRQAILALVLGELE
ncbi:MAG: aspartate carbamoyltransferase [Nanoarchaeota archaeon]|nr:aspartate carbamoyltransferase [Nanoarchaeota archaeon]